MIYYRQNEWPAEKLPPEQQAAIERWQGPTGITRAIEPNRIAHRTITMTTDTLDLFTTLEAASDPVNASDSPASQQPTGVKKQLLDLLSEQEPQPISKVRDNLIAFGGPEMYSCQVWELLDGLENEGLVRTDFDSGERLYHLS